MKVRHLALGIAGLLSIGGVAWAARPELSPLPQPPAAQAAVLPALTPRYHTWTHEVQEGETASEVLRALCKEAHAAGLGDDAAPEAWYRALIGAAGSRLDSLSIGAELHLDAREGDTRPWRLRLDRDGPAELTLVDRGESYAVELRPIPYRIESGVKEMVISSSLWESGLAAGMRPTQIGNLAKIFEYDVDFNTELVKGAVLRIVADTLTDEDGRVRVGDIRAALLQNGKDSFVSLRFRDSSGQVGWFAPDGLGRRKPFLRSPLAFSRVTSSFSKGRYHPILQKTRPHYGVDLGAPAGTPVRAVADGVVTDASYHGGHGNYIELDHEGPYGTSYSHLSAILVKRGQKVHQGDVIGRVGSTGLSTGPHLHYQFTVNGRYVDPMTTVLPLSGGEMSVADKAAFDALKAELLPQLRAPLAPAAATKEADGSVDNEEAEKPTTNAG